MRHCAAHNNPQQSCDWKTTEIAQVENVGYSIIKRISMLQQKFNHAVQVGVHVETILARV